MHRDETAGSHVLHSELWQRVEASFHALLPLEAAERAEHLAALWLSDPAAADNVGSLLRDAALTGDGEEAAKGASPTRSADPSGERSLAQSALRVGFELGPVIGKGGMSVVYAARQLHPSRPVALKILAPDLYESTRATMRLLDEATMLADLDHPCIARVFGAGTLEYDAGRAPYISMEYFEHAMPITAYAPLHALTLAARFAMLVDVCGAVQHAHRRGVIHRDIKPSNILVRAVTPGERPMVKVIDFGIAKRDQGVNPESALSLVGAMLGTPLYMSPEQLRSSRGGADTRSDVYALGVVAYELVTGAVPYPGSHDQFPALLTAILGGEVVPPQSRVPGLPKDVTSILLKALALDPAQRYQSPAELAQDVERFLDHRPTVARPGSSLRRVAMKLRRNPRVASAAAIAFLALAGAGAALKHSRSSALLDRSAADQTMRLIDLVLRAPEAQAAGASAKAVDLLPEIERQLDHSRDLRDETSFVLRGALGGAYDTLGRPEQAIVQFEKAAHHAARAFGDEDPRVLRELVEAAGPLYDLGRYEEASIALQGILARQRAALGDRHLDTAKTQNDLGLLYLRLGRYREAKQVLDDALVTREGVLGPDDLLSIQTRLNDAISSRFLGDQADAESKLRSVLVLYEQKSPKPERLLARTRMLLADVLLDRDEPDESRALIDAGIAALRMTVEPTHMWMREAEATLARSKER